VTTGGTYLINLPENKERGPDHRAGTAPFKKPATRQTPTYGKHRKKLGRMGGPREESLASPPGMNSIRRGAAPSKIQVKEKKRKRRLLITISSKECCRQRRGKRKPIERKGTAISTNNHEEESFKDRKYDKTIKIKKEKARAKRPSRRMTQGHRYRGGKIAGKNWPRPRDQKGKKNQRTTGKKRGNIRGGRNASCPEKKKKRQLERKKTDSSSCKKRKKKGEPEKMRE